MSATATNNIHGLCVGGPDDGKPLTATHVDVKVCTSRAPTLLNPSRLLVLGTYNWDHKASLWRWTPT